MRRVIAAIVLSIVASTASCLFQNEILAPNRPPIINLYAPLIESLTLSIPDSCVFAVKATDPDGDELRYSWFVCDSLVGTSASMVYHAVRPEDCYVRAIVQDGSRKAIREWHVRVLSKSNLPPRIEWFYPEQKNIACAVGDTLEFHIRASDDEPSSLRYLYLLDGSILHSGSPDLLNRFMERGEFILQGVAWDGQFGDTVGWNVTVTGFPDTLPPAAITDLIGGPGEVDGSIWLEWTAPGDDGTEGRCEAYIVRTSTYPIVTEQDWREAEGKPGEPTPSAAGTRERMTIRNLVSASAVYVMMRAVDDFFNISPLGNCIRVNVRGIDVHGRVLNAESGEGVPGVVVQVGIRSDTSSSDGEYFLRDVPSYATRITARDESKNGDPGDYYDLSMNLPSISQSISIDCLMMPVFGLVNIVPPDQYAGRFIAFFKGITKTTGDAGTTTVYKGWNHWPLSFFAGHFQHAGIDLAEVAYGSSSDWESYTGLDLFVQAASEESADVVVRYDTLNDYRHNVKTTYNPDGTPRRREIWVYTRNTELPLSGYAHLIFMHELGHVIGLDHSRNVGHLMVGLTTPQVEYPTTDEIRVVRCLCRYPFIFDYSNVLEE